MTGQSYLYLLIGRLKPHGLEQSNLSSGYDDPIWKKINRDLKRHATAGADWVNDVKGLIRFVRNDRFTPGAKALAASGTPLRQRGDTSTHFQPK